VQHGNNLANKSCTCLTTLFRQFFISPSTVELTYKHLTKSSAQAKLQGYNNRADAIIKKTYPMGYWIPMGRVSSF